MHPSAAVWLDWWQSAMAFGELVLRDLQVAVDREEPPGEAVEEGRCGRRAAPASIACGRLLRQRPVGVVRPSSSGTAAPPLRRRRWPAVPRRGSRRSARPRHRPSRSRRASRRAGRAPRSGRRGRRRGCRSRSRRSASPTGRSHGGRRRCTRKPASRSGPTWCAHASAESGQPWIRTTGGPRRRCRRHEAERRLASVIAGILAGVAVLPATSRARRVPAPLLGRHSDGEPAGRSGVAAPRMRRRAGQPVDQRPRRRRQHRPRRRRRRGAPGGAGATCIASSTSGARSGGKTQASASTATSVTTRPVRTPRQKP